MRRAARAALALFWGAGAAFAKAPGSAFLEIPTGARTEAMGGSGWALSRDASSLFQNPAGLSAVLGPQMFFEYSREALDLTRQAFSVALPGKLEKFSLAFGGIRMDSGKLEGRDENGNPTSDFTAQDLALSLGAGARRGSFSFGLALKGLESKIGKDRAAGFALDAGAGKSFGPLAAHVVLANLGQGQKFLSQRDPLPTSLSSALSLEQSKLSSALSLTRRIPDGKTSFSLGAEGRPFGPVFFRAGYDTSPRFGANRLSGMGMGVGLKLSRFQLDFSFRPLGELGSQRISARVEF